MRMVSRRTSCTQSPVSARNVRSNTYFTCKAGGCFFFRVAGVADPHTPRLDLELYNFFPYFPHPKMVPGHKFINVAFGFCYFAVNDE